MTVKGERTAGLYFGSMMEPDSTSELLENQLYYPAAAGNVQFFGGLDAVVQENWTNPASQESKGVGSILLSR